MDTHMYLEPCATLLALLSLPPSHNTILSNNLVIVFMEQALMQIGFYHVVYFEAYNKFKAVQNSLSLQLSAAAKSNYQAVRIIWFYRYANRAIKFAT